MEALLAKPMQAAPGAHASRLLSLTEAPGLGCIGELVIPVPMQVPDKMEEKRLGTRRRCPMDRSMRWWIDAVLPLTIRAYGSSRSHSEHGLWTEPSDRASRNGWEWLGMAGNGFADAGASGFEGVDDRVSDGGTGPPPEDPDTAGSGDGGIGCPEPDGGCGDEASGVAVTRQGLTQADTTVADCVNMCQ